MNRRKRFVLWLAEKLGVGLAEHYHDKFFPDEKEDWFEYLTEMIEDEFSLVTNHGIEKFVTEWCEHNEFDEEEVASIAIGLGESFGFDFEEQYRPKSAEHFAEDIEKARKNDDEEKDDIGFVEFLEYIALEKGVEEELEEKYDSNPVEHIYELEDSRDKLYIWKLPSEWSDQKRDNLFARLVSSYREKFSRDPESAHLLLTELEEVQNVDRDEMKELLGWAGEDL